MCEEIIRKDERVIQLAKEVGACGTFLVHIAHTHVYGQASNPTRYSLMDGPSVSA